MIPALLRNFRGLACAGAVIACLSGGPAFAQTDTLQPRNDVLAPSPAAPESAPSTLPESSIPAASDTKKLDLTTSGALTYEAPETIAPEDVPDILMQEVNEIEASCNANYFFSSFHDCRCIAVKFLDARAKSDPTASRDMVFKSIASQCPDKVSIAGFAYRSCYDHMKLHRPDDYREFCECSANQMAEQYGERPNANLRYIEMLRKNAFLDCGMRENPAYRVPPAYQAIR